VRRFVVVSWIVAALLAPAAARAAATGGWIRPVSGAVVRPFDPPESRFGAGHLGVDLVAPSGTPVVAAGPGVVSFAGTVAGTRHVVIAHAGNLRTSYSFLASITVRRGDAVRAGDVVGTTGGTGQGHDGHVLHFGLRSADTYLDPMTLLGPPDLTAIVHLAPTSEPPRPVSERSERHGLLDGLAHAAHAVVHIGADAFTAGIDALARTHPMEAAVVRGVHEWMAQRDSCQDNAPPANGEGGSEHRVMVVAGIESSSAPNHVPSALPVDELGYTPDEVTYFSYAADGGDYDAHDTEGSILVAAHRLADQLRELERSEPGREVDLIAHSQGGVVVETFLTQIYDRGDPSYPPLGTVVTLSSPLQGAPLANVAAAVERSRTGDDVLRRRLPMARAPGVRDLASDSDLMRRVGEAPLPDLVELTTIGSATDVIVPGTAAVRPGARGATVIPHALDAHAAIVTDPEALANVRAALEDRPLPCRSLLTSVAGEVVPTLVTDAEIGAGGALAALGRVADLAR